MAKKPEPIFGTRPSPRIFYGIQENAAELEAKYDKQGILKDPTMKTEHSERLITVPSDYPDIKDFDVATEAPEIDFAIVQETEPWYLPNNAEDLDATPMTKSGGFGIWTGFGAINYGPDGCYYYSIGNHLYYGGSAYMMKYDPKEKKQSICFDLKDVLGWTDDMWTDGKIHGNPDIDSDGNMFVPTFSGPRPLDADLSSKEIDYRGGNVVRYNIFDGTIEDLGVPLEGDTWCYSAYDMKQGLLFAVGQARNRVMVYDTVNKKLLYGGHPDGVTWWRRCILVDDESSLIFSSDSSVDGGTGRIISYERRNHTFRAYDAQTPQNPVTGKHEPLRSHTRRRDPSGKYWCFDQTGHMFTFEPDKMEITSLGPNWGEIGKYTPSICQSPGGRYLYYVPGAHGHIYKYGTPVVQYDTKRNTKKVVAFLNDYFLDKYGYCAYGAFGLELDPTGKDLFFYVNGLFTERSLGSGYGRPALFNVHIPASECEE